jgi:hypothetical protein
MDASYSVVFGNPEEVAILVVSILLVFKHYPINTTLPFKTLNPQKLMGIFCQGIFFLIFFSQIVRMATSLI